MAAKFIVRHRTGHGWHFVLTATNGKVIASSENYETRRACLEGIESVKMNVPKADVVDEPGEAGSKPKSSEMPA